MSAQRRGLAAVVLVAALAAGALALGPLASSAAPAVARLGALAPAQRVRFTLDLVLPREHALSRALAALESARAPSGRRFVGPRAFGARYGLSAAALATLRRRLAADGIRVLASYPQRTALEVGATVAAVRRTFGVALARFADRSGVRWHAPLGRPAIPRALRGLVSAVVGLSTRPVWRAADVPSGGLAQPDTGLAYDIAPLARLGILGQGQSIAIIALSDYNRSDPHAYARQFHLRGPEPTVIPVDGGTTDTSGADETDLDIEVMRSVAPAAHVLVYEAPDTPSGYDDVINRIVADHRASIISTSWGQCIPDLGPGQQASDEKALRAAVSAGITLLAASGDNGAYDCQANALDDHRLSVDWPGASDDAISVGGTRLYLNADGSYLREGAWESVLSNGGGGGGLATGVARPAWQAGPGVQNSFSNGQRQVPDVSANADSGTGWAIYFSQPTGPGTFAPGSLTEVGGTSAATPFWAAALALVAQYASAHGAGRLGFAAPMLYALAGGHPAFAPFHDVTIGGNRFYPATPGWDFATGLGSPDVYDIARDAVAYLRR